MIRKHSARAVKYVNTTGKVEMFIQIGGKWYINGWERGVELKFEVVKRQPVKDFINESFNGFSDQALEHFSGKSIKQLLSKSFIYEWTSNQTLYGVPF